MIHLAARVHILNDQAKNPKAEFERINAEGTKKLAKLAKLAKQKHASQFVFISSIHVSGQQTNGMAFTEEQQADPHGAYAISKHNAEQELADIFKESETQWCIIRPPLVYGPGVKGNLEALENILKKQIPLPFASLNAKRHFVYVGNLISAIEAVVEKPEQSHQQLFLVADNESFATDELMKIMATILGLKTKILPCPVWLLSLLFTCLGKKEQLDKLNAELLVSNEKIKQMLDWQPPYTLEQGLQKMFSPLFYSPAAKGAP